jgi:NitT/TauT family transport system substrate-binding protein
MRRLLAVVAVAAAAALGCSRRDPKEGPLVLGFFPNVTHAQALVGNREGLFEKAAGPAGLKTKQFNAGPAAMEALLAGEVDVVYCGPAPAIVAYVRSGGKVKVIAGAASGGAGLVVKGISSPDELAGETVAIPQIGNTQDIAARRWLRQHGHPPDGVGGDVMVVPLHNAEIVNLFKNGRLKAAWVPEPWVARLMAEAGASLLVDERTLWPGGRFPTTVLLATDEALQHRRDQVKAILRTHVELTARAKQDPERFRIATNEAFSALTGKKVPVPVMVDAFSRLELLTDPMEEQLKVEAEHAAQIGYIPHPEVEGLVDRSLLDELEAARRR